MKWKKRNKESIYPVYAVEDNIITTKDGKQSYNYECIPKDLEQCDETTILSLYAHLRNFLNSLDESIWIKIYRWNVDKIYISTNQDCLDIPEVEIQKLDEPLFHFYGEVNPYSDIDFYESYLTVNTEYWRMVHMELPPLNSSESFLDEYSCDYVVNVNRIGTNKAKRTLNQKRRTQGVTLNTDHQNHEGEASYDEANKLLKDIIYEGESIFDVSVSFVVKADTLERLNERSSLLIKSLKNHGAKAFLETRGLDYFFNRLLFGVPPSKLKSIEMESAYLSNIIPYTRDYLHEKGLELVANNGNSIWLDLYDKYSSNQNWLITGESGEGKSFLAVNIMLELFKQGIKIGIFDLGQSLRKAVLYIGGTDLSKNFNPLQFRCPHYLKNFMVSAIGTENISKKEEGQLFSEIELALQSNIETFKDLVDIISKKMSGIEYYFSEFWEYFTDGEMDVPKVFYVDIEGIPDNLVAPYLVFANELSSRQKGKICLFFEECWHVFDKCPEIITRSVKTGRKNLIANIFITQAVVELSDKYGNIANAILGNTYGKIYFHQINRNHPVLSSFERDILSDVKSLKKVYSEFLFSSPDYKKVGVLRASNLIYELSHSEKEDNKRQKEFIEKYTDIMSYKDATDKWVRAMYE